MLSRLQAINQMLTPIGEQVHLVEAAGASDYANAGAVLDAETLKVLAKGHHFNTETEVPYVPDVNGKIAVPPNVLVIDATEKWRDVANRAGFLYDKQARSEVFTSELLCDHILAFSFEQCPYMVQRLIVAQAAKAYQRGYVGSPQLDGFAQEERLEAGADHADAEFEVDDFNVLDNPDLAYLRRRTMRRPI